MKPGAANAMLEGQKAHSAFLLARTQREGFLRHFGFRESPFGVTPNPEFLFWSRMHNAALQALIASIESNLGFSVLLGGPGTGKTTLLFHLLAEYRESARTAFVFQTQCRAHDLIRHIASELELPVDRRDDVSLHQKLNEMLLHEARAGRRVVIIIDEAQNLQVSSLEAIRLLSDFETGHSKLLNVVLSGSTRLGETLLSPELSQFAQRISSISRLEALAVDEVKEYVRFRLSVVTSRGVQEVFSPESLAEIASRSDGIPRIINSLCYRALILAYTHGQPSVSTELVRQAARDLDLSEPGRDSTEAPQLAETREARVSSAVPPVLTAAINKPPWNPMASAFERRRALDIETNIAGQTVPGVPDLEHHNIDLCRKSPREGSDQGSDVKTTTAIWSTRRSIGLMAAFVLLACGAWVGWKELPWRQSTSTAAGSEAQPSVRETKNEIPLNEPNASAATAATKRRNHQPPISPLIDGRPNVLPSSKIGSQGSIPEEPLVPTNVASISTNSKNLALLATAGPSVSPRLETPGVRTSTAQGPYSRQPIKVVKPEYPERALFSHIEGEVEVELTIDQNGNVQNVRGLSGNFILLQAAEEAARQWQYSPAAGDETTSPVVTRVQFKFRLNR